MCPLPPAPTAEEGPCAHPLLLPGRHADGLCRVLFVYGAVAMAGYASNSATSLLLFDLGQEHLHSKGRSENENVGENLLPIFLHFLFFFLVPFFILFSSPSFLAHSLLFLSIFSVSTFSVLFLSLSFTLFPSSYSFPPPLSFRCLVVPLMFPLLHPFHLSSSSSLSSLSRSSPSCHCVPTNSLKHCWLAHGLFNVCLCLCQVISWSSLDWTRTSETKARWEWDIILGTAFDVIVHAINTYILSQFLTTVELLVAIAMVSGTSLVVLYNPRFAWCNPSCVPGWVSRRVVPVDLPEVDRSSIFLTKND